MYYAPIEWGVTETNICAPLTYNIYVEIEGNVSMYKHKAWPGHLSYSKNTFSLRVLQLISSVWTIVFPQYITNWAGNDNHFIILIVNNYISLIKLQYDASDLNYNWSQQMWIKLWCILLIRWLTSQIRTSPAHLCKTCFGKLNED